MFWTALLAFGAVYALQTVLALRQMNDFSRVFTELRRRGRVAIGKKKSLLVSGAIVMFLVDDAGVIVDGRRLSGVTVLSRFRSFGAFDGLRLVDLDAEGDRRLPPSVRQAVHNARDNFVTITNGGVAPEPLSPLAQIGARFRRNKGRDVVPAS